MARDGAMARRASGLKRGLMIGFLIFAAAAFTALGVWQIERRAWKLGLIAAVDQRVHAAPGPAPGPAAWPQVTAARDAYRHVRVRGTFLHDRETWVQAVTERGPGFWVMTPLRSEAGWTVLVNRGFVPAERREPASRAAGQVPGPVVLTGLVRLSEPRGGFLRANAPAAGRWYSRDVSAIALARGLGGREEGREAVAPYFIDADATPNPGGYPVGGLTVVAFPNSHMTYILTWFTLAIMAVAALLAGPLRRSDEGAGRP
jgi:surfeit locus 1 family protein